MIYTILLILYMVFGLVFYDLPYFQMVDEIFPFLILAVSFLYKGKIKKSLILYFAFAIFYLVYSFLIKSNVPKAILFDFICFSKPFLTLFSVLVLSPSLTKNECQIIRIVILCLIPVLIYAGINVHLTQETISGQLLSGARYSFCCIYVGLTYYLFSPRRKMDVLVMLFYILLGVMLPTSKYIALVAVVCCVFLLTEKRKLTFDFKTVTLLILSIGIIIFFAIDDFELYLSEDVARGAMYITAGQILLDHIPFGLGFASFSTPASASYYSDAYYDYALDKVYGLTPSDPAFVSDAFLPSLAEFGFVGIILFIFFVIYLLIAVKKCNDKGTYRVGMIIIADIIIESISDVSIIGNRGVYAMLLLGYVISSSKVNLSKM